MTPADLAELLKTTAAAVLADARPRPRGAARDRHRRASPQPRARRLRHQPGHAGRQEGRRQPPRAGRLAGRSAGGEPTGIAAADVAGPGFLNLRIEAIGAGRRRRQRAGRGCRLRHSDDARRQEHQPRVRLRQPDRAHPHRRHPLGRRRRRAGPAAEHPGRRRWSASTTSTTTARRSTGSPGRWSPPPRASPPRRTATRATTSPTSPPRSCRRRPTR